MKSPIEQIEDIINEHAFVIYEWRQGANDENRSINWKDIRSKLKKLRKKYPTLENSLTICITTTLGDTLTWQLGKNFYGVKFTRNDKICKE